MACKKRTPGRPCGCDCSCGATCAGHLLASPYACTVTDLPLSSTASLNLRQNTTPGWECLYGDSVCIVKTPILLNDWTWAQPAFDNPALPAGVTSDMAPCYPCCAGNSFEEIQISRKFAWRHKRWSQVILGLSLSLFPCDVAGNATNACTDKLRFIATLSYAKLYVIGSSEQGLFRYRKITKTCPITGGGVPGSVSAGAWVYGTSPALLEPAYPKYFVGPYVSTWPYLIGGSGTCTWDRGPEQPIVTSITTTNVGSWNKITAVTSTAGPCVCTAGTYPVYAPDDYSVRENAFGSSPQGLPWGSYWTGTTIAQMYDECYPFPSGWGPTYKYYSDVFSCLSWPSSPITLKRNPHTALIGSTSTVGPYKPFNPADGADQYFDYENPTIPADLTLTL